MVIVTASFGGYDTPKVHVAQSDGTRIVTLTKHFGRCQRPRLAAKMPKLYPWRYDDDGPWIWIDGAFQIISATFAAEAVAAVGDGPIGQWVHPWRDCVYDEASASSGLAKYRDEAIQHQADHYRQSGHPSHWGLWAAGLIVYREAVEEFTKAWWSEIIAWTVQDQISEPVVLRRHGLRPIALPGGLHASPWLRWHPHVSEAR